MPETPSETLSVLMYHSISAGPAPLCVAPDLFRHQLETLADGGYRGVSVAELAGWMRGDADLPTRTVVLTFDDGYVDFATTALPLVAARGWHCTLFVPAGRLGDPSGRWPGAPPIPLLDTAAVADLPSTVVEVGAHGVTHRDLRTLAPAAAAAEVVESGSRLATAAGRPITSFAAPYGGLTTTLRDIVRRHYDCAVGTTMGRVARGGDRWDVPRIDMCYFADPARWRRFVTHGPGVYFQTRRWLRATRTRLSARRPGPDDA